MTGEQIEKRMKAQENSTVSKKLDTIDRVLQANIRAVMGTEEGKSFLLYIIGKLGYFDVAKDDRAVAERNAAVKLLDDITERSGQTLNVRFV